MDASDDHLPDTLPYKPLPMPIWLVTDHHLLRTATGNVRRSVIVLSLHFWLAGCQSLPSDDTALASLAATNITMWTKDRDETKRILKVVLATLKKHFDKEYTKVLAKRERSLVAYALSRVAVARKKEMVTLQNAQAEPVVTSTRRVSVPKPPAPADIPDPRADYTPARGGDKQYTIIPVGFRD